jgi:hypothetical protein
MTYLRAHSWCRALSRQHHRHRRAEGACRQDRRATYGRLCAVTLTDWVFTLGGVVLILIGAYGMVWTGGLNPLGPLWLIAGQSLFIAWHCLGGNPDPDADQTSECNSCLCLRRQHPCKLLASRPALDRLGHDRPLLPPLSHGGEARLSCHRNHMKVTTTNSGNRMAPDHNM